LMKKMEELERRGIIKVVRKSDKDKPNEGEKKEEDKPDSKK